jgi:glycyl-tRNA synthetase
MENLEKSMEKIVALAKGRGFVYSGSEIYGGLANTWDYGPLGVEFKNNVKRAWWKKFVQQSPYNVGLDSAILMNPQVWVALACGWLFRPAHGLPQLQDPPPGRQID